MKERFLIYSGWEVQSLSPAAGAVRKPSSQDESPDKVNKCECTECPVLTF